MPEKTSDKANEYLNLMASHGLRTGINVPTRLNGCLDHFMIKTESIPHTLVFEKFTDHCPILLHIANTNFSHRKQDTTQRVRINYDKVGEILKSVDWNHFYQIKSVNEAAEYLVDKLKNTVETSSTCVNIPSRKRPLKPWITINVVKCIRKRDKLHKKLRKYNNNEELKTVYILYRNTCNKVIKSLKRKYYREQLQKHSGNSKETWKIIKGICNLKTQINLPIDLLKIKDNPTDSLNEGNNYFTSIGRVLANATTSKTGLSESSLALKINSLNGPLRSRCPSFQLTLSKYLVLSRR
ncbi:putative tick transposon [Operophtera brumata]|uniref:Putative tick transposon n=1 Tax=Operophtera brumata TaxID=104452 RepID=A0A0L7LUA4_OPEBR|nr:putative tick transposon [Operophtera brumata]